MINLDIRNTRISGLCYEPITVGSVNSIFISCCFDDRWKQLVRVAVFSNGSVSVSVPMDGDVCPIPHEVLEEAGELTVSFRGTGDGGDVVLCTQDRLLGNVMPNHASTLPEESASATPDVIDTLLADVAALKAGGTGEGGTGAAGKSAYEIAQDNGFEGTEQEWLASLHGADGANGQDGADGIDGSDGADGYTPVKGVDYFTAADIAEIAAQVDLSGYATENYVVLAVQSAIAAVDDLIGSGVIE